MHQIFSNVNLHRSLEIKWTWFAISLGWSKIPHFQKAPMWCQCCWTTFWDRELHSHHSSDTNSLLSGYWPKTVDRSHNYHNRCRKNIWENPTLCHNNTEESKTTRKLPQSDEGHLWKFTTTIIVNLKRLDVLLPK